MSDHPLRQWRTKNNITLLNFAKLCQTTAASISRIERGVQDPSLAMMVRIIKATGDGVNLNHFLCWVPNDKA
jgi:transcriptional regulator with XRE-family HTH domain